MTSVKQRLITEMKSFLSYAVISTIAAIFCFGELMDRVYRTAEAGADINAVGTLKVLIDGYLVPFLGVFFVLSTVRIAIVCLWKRPDK
jgi:hypothetical protein